MKHVIFSSGRMKWINKKKSDTCIFCSISKRDGKEKSFELYRDDFLMVILNIFPYNTGHLQVVPLRHTEKLEEMNDDEVSMLFIMAKKCMKLLSKTYKPCGFNVGINEGGCDAGGSINHLHVHIVPRYRRDFGFMETIAETKVIPESPKETFRALLKNADMLG